MLVSTLCTAQEYINDSAVDSIKAEQEKKFDWDKVYAGGGLGFQFGNYTFIDIAPVFGYRINPDFSVGVGITYKYFQDNSYKDYKTHIYGGSIFGNYIFFKNFFAHLEFELINLDVIVLDLNGNVSSKERRDLNYFWIGGGYRQPVGENSFLVLTLLYNVLDTKGFFYPNPIYRIGFNIGL
ncbi:MAG: hypothetical protein COB85_06185 [Bacteroidetes bacterium]|nr:MAG: hypothetical protein COB85_06185 [Bacteroidota bacterium]